MSTSYTGHQDAAACALAQRDRRLCLLLVDEGSTASYTFRIMKTIVVVGLLACSGLAAAQSQSTSTADDREKAAVLSVVTRMFDAMATRDVQAYSALLVPEAMTIRVKVGPHGTEVPRFRSNADDIAKFAGTDMWQERIWDPTVLVHSPLAIVWAPYDFHIKGVFSHCGVDVFEFLKVGDAWRMSNASWTVETEKCPPSPLGPIKPQGGDRNRK
jgi:hypothetical protein